MTRIPKYGGGFYEEWELPTAAELAQDAAEATVENGPGSADALRARAAELGIANPANATYDELVAYVTANSDDDLPF